MGEETGYRLTKEEQRYGFADIFLDELEHACDSNIICCDHCVDEFKNLFPSLYEANDCRFQRNTIDPILFYEGSRLPEIIDQDVFISEYALLSCPRCKKLLGDSLMYYYSFSVEFGEELELGIEEISDISKSTPFLLLKHPLARRLSDIIECASETINSQIILLPLYRARSQKKCEHPEEKNQFEFPPPDKVYEGRFNHLAQPVLYLADSVETAYEELRKVPSYIADVQISGSLKILDIRPDNHFCNEADINALLFSCAITAEVDSEQWAKPEYVFTRFIADCARYYGFDAIRYSSTRRRNDAWNLVVLNTGVKIEVGQIRSYS